MANLMRVEEHSVSFGDVDWSAVWGGSFTFLGIWSVFELLGLAIFAAPSSGAKVGLGVWSIILTAIAMFIAGRLTGLGARVAGRTGLWHGMVMFGLSLTMMIVLIMAGTVLLTDFPALNMSARTSDLVKVFSASDWVPFAALFLGWLGAIIGASSVGPSKTVQPSTVTEMRPAA
jgi:hypothetical protein